MRKLFLLIFIVVLYVKVVCAETYSPKMTQSQESRCLNYTTEYYVNKSRINSIFQERKYLENIKENNSVLNKQGSIQRSRIQAVINAKSDEVFRLNRRNDFISNDRTRR